MPNVTRGADGQGYKKAVHGDVRSLVRIDNPDDAEFADELGTEISSPLGEDGDAESLVKIDSPDDAEFYDPDDRSGGKAGAADDGKGTAFKKTR